MTGFIEREALRDALYEADAITMRGVAMLNQFPAADVRSVVRGRWKRRKNWSRCVCSACSYESETEYHFCPNCGAMMEES